MEGHQILDVPITEQEHDHRNSIAQERERDARSRLSSDNEGRLLQDDGIQPTLGRFHSLRSSAPPPPPPPPPVEETNYTNPNYTIDGPVVHHQRIPSNATDLVQRIFHFHQQTGYDTSVNYDRMTYPPDLWRPLWTRTSTLAVFLCSFVVVIVALVLLWHFSQSLNGFKVDSSTKYYAWTYSPVAFMVVLVGLWKPIDYYVKLLAPWDELRVGPVPASKSLLLDYVSPINFVSFFVAFKRGYIPVVLSTTVFFALQVSLVFSAALFYFQPTIITFNGKSGVSTTHFAASSFDPSTFPNASAFDSVPVYAAIGNLIYGLPFETGAGENYAYIPVNLNLTAHPELENATYAAQTDAFLPDLTCEVLDVTIGGSGAVVRASRSTANTTNNYLSLRLPNVTTCSTWASNPTVYAMNPQKQKTPSRQIEGTMQPVYCAGKQDQENSYVEPVGLLFTLTDIRYDQNVSRNGTVSNSLRNVSDMTNLLCHPSYQIGTANVANTSAIYGVNAVSVQVSDSPYETLNSLSNRSLAVLYDGILNASEGIFGTRQQHPLANTIPSTVFDLMALTANQSSLEPFFDAQEMQHAARLTFQRVMSHYAALSLTAPHPRNVTAGSTFMTPKLHVSLIPFYIMAGSIGLCVICTASLLKLTPGPRVPKDPSMIAMSAAVLARSPELNRLLRNQAYSEIPMVAALSGHEFSSAIAITEQAQSSFKIVATEAPSAQSLSGKRASSKWWSPNTLLLPAFFMTVAVPAALIAVLEVLQRRSDRNDGLTAANFGPYIAMYSRCIPVLVMLLIAATVGFLNFYVALLSPWNKLASGNCKASRSLLSHLLGKLPPIALVEAIRDRHIGAGFSMSATIIASIFAIIASGLYTVKDFTSSGPQQALLPSNTLALQGNYSVFNDLGAAGMTSWLGTTSTPYTAGTYNNLVYSIYDQSPLESLSIPSARYKGSAIKAVIPAYRANLSCQLLPDGGSQVNRIPVSRLNPTAYLRVDSHYPLPDVCQLGGREGDLPSASFQNRFNISGNHTTMYGGQLLDLVFGANSGSVNHYAETNAAAVGDNPPVGCPSLAFTFVEYNVTSDHAVVTAMYCYQQVQQFDVNVTYQQNSSDIDLNYPPAVLDSSMSTVSNPDSSINASNTFDWRIQMNIERQLYGLNGQTLQSGLPAVSYQFDAFFSYLFSTVYEKSPATLVGTSNQQTLQNVINTLYSKYMAQAISGNFRVPVISSSNSDRKRQSGPGAVNSPTTIIRSRLVQDKTSMRILEVLLGVTALFCIFSYAYMFTSFHRLLPHNPTSIAGTMSLLAGSDLCWTPEDNLCDCCGRPRRNSWNHELVRHHEGSIDADASEYQSTITSGPPRTARDQVIVHGTEWMRYDLFAKVFASRSYSLGWWKEDRTKARRRRYGVDIGSQADDDTEDEWESSGHRKETGSRALGRVVSRGRDNMGDQRGHYERAVHTDVGPEPSPDIGEQTISPLRAPEHWSSPTLAMSSTASLRRKLSPMSRRTPSPEMLRKMSSPTTYQPSSFVPRKPSPITARPPTPLIPGQPSSSSLGRQPAFPVASQPSPPVTFRPTFQAAQQPRPIVTTQQPLSAVARQPSPVLSPTETSTMSPVLSPRTQGRQSSPTLGTGPPHRSASPPPPMPTRNATTATATTATTDLSPTSALLRELRTPTSPSRRVRFEDEHQDRLFEEDEDGVGNYV